jgi:hypothetical protein
MSGECGHARANADQVLHGPLSIGKQKTPEGTPGVLCSAGQLAWRALTLASVEPAIHDYYSRAKLLPPRHASPGLNTVGSWRPSLFSCP